MFAKKLEITKYVYYILVRYIQHHLKDLNISNISKLSKIFELPVGLSDHTIGNTAAISAVTLGAKKIIEKHITLNKKVMDQIIFTLQNLKNLEIMLKKLENVKN